MVKAQIPLNEMIKKYINKLGENINVEKVILFGSRARGDELKDSDVDLIVISEDFKEMHYLKRLEFLELNWDYSMPLEAIGYTKKEYDELSQSLGIVREIDEQGIIIS